MSRTLGAAVAAGLIGFAAAAGIGMLLGFPALPSLVAGLVLGAVTALLLVAAAARAGTFDEPTRPMPRHPGEPPTTDDDQTR